jgi:hypothetical protein
MRCRNFILPVVLTVAPFVMQGQGTSRVLSELYAYVHQTDSLLDRSEKTFYLEKYLDDNYNYRETWHYLMHDGHIIYFEIVYIIDTTEYSEIYYLKRGNLVCSEEYEKITYSYLEDKLKYGCIYYFDSSVPRHVVTMGKRSDNDKAYNYIHPEDLALVRFEKRYTELKKHLPMLLQ